MSNCPHCNWPQEEDDVRECFVCGESGCSQCMAPYGDEGNGIYICGPCKDDIEDRKDTP